MRRLVVGVAVGVLLREWKVMTAELSASVSSSEGSAEQGTMSSFRSLGRNEGKVGTRDGSRVRPRERERERVVGSAKGGAGRSTRGQLSERDGVPGRVVRGSLHVEEQWLEGRREGGQADDSGWARRGEAEGT